MNARTLVRTLALLILGFSTSCGPASDKVDVRLRTGLEYKGNFKNLMNGLTALPTCSSTCVQKNLYAVTSPGDKPEAALDTFRIPMVTPMCNSLSDYPIDALWIRNYAAFPPISVPVTRGLDTGVGIVGSLTWSQSLDAGGDTCSDFGTGNIPYSTTSIFGHTRVNTSTSIDLPLKVWVLPSTAMPSPTPTAGDPACFTDNGSNQNCPSNDYLILTCDICSATPQKNIQLEYAFSRNLPGQRVIQWIPANDTAVAGVARPISIPDIMPVTLRVVSPSYPMQEFRIGEADFPQVYGPRTVQRVVPAGAIGPTGITLNLTQRMRAPPLLIGHFTVDPFNGKGTGPGSANMSWAPAANATSYDILLSTDGGTTFSTYATTSNTFFSLTGFIGYAGQNLYFKVTAKNSMGSPPQPSDNQELYIPIASWSTFTPAMTTGSVGSGTINVSWGSYPTGATSSSYVHLHRVVTATSTDTLITTWTGVAVTNYSDNVGSGVSAKYYVRVINDYGGYSETNTTTAVTGP